jgi:hypothetical protein
MLEFGFRRTGFTVYSQLRKMAVPQSKWGNIGYQQFFGLRAFRPYSLDGLCPPAVIIEISLVGRDHRPHP